MEAVKVGDEGVAIVDEGLRIGCGVCLPTCDNGAVALERRKHTRPPPDLMEFLAARMEGK